MKDLALHKILQYVFYYFKNTFFFFFTLDGSLSETEYPYNSPSNKTFKKIFHILLL